MNLNSLIYFMMTTKQITFFPFPVVLQTKMFAGTSSKDSHENSDIVKFSTTTHIDFIRRIIGFTLPFHSNL